MNLIGKYTGFKYEVRYSDYMRGCYYLCYTDENNRKRSPTIGFKLYRHSTKEKAKKQLDDYDRQIYIDSLGKLDWDEYITECKKLGLDVKPMEWGSYGLKYWDPGAAQASLIESSTLNLARKHQKYLDELPTDIKVNAPVAIVLCDCGHTVPSNFVMYAMGSSCPECYDTLSD